MTNIIELKNISKNYRSKTALKDLTLSIKKGSVFGLIGPNGAGKTTTIKIISDITIPNAGRVTIFGQKIIGDLYKKKIGVVPEDSCLFDQLNGVEQLNFIGGVYGLTQKQIKIRSNELFALFDLSEQKNDFIFTYSKGMKKKLAIMCSLIHNPEIIVLDEPFEGMDAIAIKKTKQLLTTLKENGTTILITSHILGYVEGLCDEVAIINKGKIIYQNTIKNIQNNFNEKMMADPKMSALESLFISLVDDDTKDSSLSWVNND